MAKRRVGRYPKEFRRMAVERLKTCDNIVELSQELGVDRRLLYKWRDQFDPFDASEESPPANSRESTLRKEINQLKRVLVDKTLELDFFKGALQKVEARRQKSGISGERASTTKSKK
ncbi:MAG: transposase [Candidatus Sulfotelmatobacter sp.]